MLFSLHFHPHSPAFSKSKTIFALHCTSSPGYVIWLCVWWLRDLPAEDQRQHRLKQNREATYHRRAKLEEKKIIYKLLVSLKKAIKHFKTNFLSEVKIFFLGWSKWQNNYKQFPGVVFHLLCSCRDIFTKQKNGIIVSWYQPTACKNAIDILSIIYKFTRSIQK